MHELPGGGLVVNDAYNANPTSMRAALVDLAERAEGRRRVAILGQMAELGDESAALPRRDRDPCSETSAIELVVAVGEDARDYLAEVEGGVSVADAGAFDDDRRPACGPVTRSSSRDRARSGSKASPR